MLAASLLPPGIEHSDQNILSAMRKLKHWPVGVTDKEDGIRGVRLNGSVSGPGLYSRTLKRIPNKSVVQRGVSLPVGFDFELVIEGKEYNEIESVVMSEEHEESNSVKFYLIDWYREGTYKDRTIFIEDWLFYNNRPDVIFRTPSICNTPEELLSVFLETESRGKEGICFRTLDSLYVQKGTIDNRSTLLEQYLVKLARFHRQEVTIIGFEEQYANTNRVKRNATGRMDRSKSLNGMVGKNTLGALLCVTSSGIPCRVGTGFDDRTRQEIWNNQSKYMNKQITIKHKRCGQLIKPRSPIFVGFREEGF
jgi:hypothetical protein